MSNIIMLLLISLQYLATLMAGRLNEPITGNIGPTPGGEAAPNSGYYRTTVTTDVFGNTYVI